MFLEAEQKEGYPATVRIVEEESSLVVYITVKAPWGKFTSPNVCGFYDEFARNVKQAFLRAQIKQPVLPSQKLSEGVKEISPLPPPCPTPSSSPPPAAVPKMSPPLLPQGKVVWVYVNLREGPGTQYKIIGKAHLKDSFGILAENPGWLRVRFENGAEGWMSNKAVTLDSSKSSPSQGLPASSPDPSQIKPSKRPLRPM
jgi:hypothetical protein